MRTKTGKNEVVFSAQSAGLTSSVSNATKGSASFHRKIDAGMRAAKQLGWTQAGIIGEFSLFLPALKETAKLEK